MKQPAPRMRRITAVIMALFILSFCGFLAYLSIMPPPALAMYASWFSIVFCFVFGLWYLAGGLFFHSRFAIAIGTGENSLFSRWFGAKGARIFFILFGAFWLLVGVVRPLINFFLR